MASTSISEKMEKPSFAKIAATGLKPPTIQQTQILTNNTSPRNIPSSSVRDKTITPPTNGHMPTPVVPAFKRLAQYQDHRDRLKRNGDSPRVSIQTVDNAPAETGAPIAGGLLNPPALDDVGTQVSSSSGSVKPQSLDGKSVASGTTFAMDEKESLRPDDSASVKAAEDDDVFVAQPHSGVGSDDGMCAFSDQLREISTMDAARRSIPPPIFGSMPRPALYNPPSGPGLGIVPTVAQETSVDKTTPDVLPDQKLFEALENPRDRVWVLKLEQDVIDFVKDAKETSLNLPQCNSFYRMLAHKMADYYMLGHLVDDSSAAVRLYKLPGSRIPPPLTGITTSSTAASTPPPAAPPMRILRRGVDKAGPGLPSGASSASKNGSDNDDAQDDGKKSKAPASREEREARYEAARLRIMGSAKPSESPEEAGRKQDSRSSSTAGRKNKKKGRVDSDDDFEARSAYSNIYGAQYGTDQLHSSPYGYSDFADVSDGQYASNSHAQPNANSNAAQYGPIPGNVYWAQQPMLPAEHMQPWMQAQPPPPYDLSMDFQRSLSFQNSAAPHVPNANFNSGYGQSYVMPPQPYAPPPGMQGSYTVGHSYLTSPAQVHDTHASYAYGQLPSQTYPGRPPSQMEHPLPGSYKSKHFNPQSQSFVPGQTNSGNSSPFPSQSVPGTGFAPAQTMQDLMQHQNSAQSQKPPYGSPRHITSHAVGNPRPSNPVMMHPLPQPVFVRQPSPNVPLPPKPGVGTPLKTPDHPHPHPHPHPHHQQLPDVSRIAPAHQMQMQPPPYKQSMIAKWGMPSSLPAKPPPSTEAYDAATAKFPHPPFPASPPTTNSAMAYRPVN